MKELARRWLTFADKDRQTCEQINREPVERTPESEQGPGTDTDDRHDSNANDR